MGNIHSLQTAILRIKPDAEVLYTNDHFELARCDLYFLPGVGNFKVAVEKIDQLNLRSLINKEVVSNKKPIMGICLGMQLLFEHGTESGNTLGLGLIEGTVERFPYSPQIKVPHIGFNHVKPHADSQLLKGLEFHDFYFVHSFRVKDVLDKELVVSQCEYGEDFVAVVESENIYGAQFHPEKSQSNGLKLLSNFLNKPN